LTKATTELGPCQVRSGTERPCSRPAVVKIRGIPFCEPCAREQETYFAIGELTEASLYPYDERLVVVLDRMKRGRGGRQHREVTGREPDAA
jgi:hypothetical protein